MNEMTFQTSALKAAMVDRGTTSIYAVHKVTGVSLATVHEILKKGHQPTSRTVNKLARGLGKEPLYFYSRVS